jgi:hypothetical protein
MLKEADQANHSSSTILRRLSSTRHFYAFSRAKAISKKTFRRSKGPELAKKLAGRPFRRRSRFAFSMPISRKMQGCGIRRCWRRCMRPGSGFPSSLGSGSSSPRSTTLSRSSAKAISSGASRSPISPLDYLEKYLQAPRGNRVIPQPYRFPQSTERESPSAGNISSCR